MATDSVTMRRDDHRPGLELARLPSRCGAVALGLLLVGLVRATFCQQPSARLRSSRSGTITSPECNVNSTDAHTIYVYKFAATHGAFFLILMLLLLAACSQAACGSGAEGKRHQRHTVNTINAVRNTT